MLEKECFKDRNTLLYIYIYICIYIYILQFFTTSDPPYSGKITTFNIDNNRSVIITSKSILLLSYFKQYMQNSNFFPHLLWNFTENFRHFLIKNPQNRVKWPYNANNHLDSHQEHTRACTEIDKSKIYVLYTSIL